MRCLAAMLVLGIAIASWVPAVHADGNGGSVCYVNGVARSCVQPAPPALNTGAGVRSKAYVIVRNESVLAVADTGTNRLVHYVPVPLGPRGLAMTPDGRKLYIGSDELSSVSVLDTATDRIVSEINVGPSPNCLAVSPDGRSILVSVSGADQMVIIDTGTDRITSRIPVPRPDVAAISPDGRTAYVASTPVVDPALVILDLVKRIPVGRVALAGFPGALSFEVDGQRLYFTVAGGDSVQVLDTQRNKVVATVAAGAPYGSVSAGTALGQLVLSRGRRALVILDPVRNIVRAAVDVGETPYGMAMSADHRTVYVTCEGLGDVLVVDLVDRRIRATIPIDNIGGAAREIAVQPGPSIVTSLGTGGPVTTGTWLAGGAGDAATSGATFAQLGGPSVCHYQDGTTLNPGGSPCGSSPWTPRGGIPF